MFNSISLNKALSAKNRIALAPMTNTQSHSDGTASKDEIAWLQRRAEGGFGMIITCASHVSKPGQGWPGQMGIFSDDLLPGLRSVAEGINRSNSLGVVQLHHGGVRAPQEITGQQPRSAVDIAISEKFPAGAKALSGEEVEHLIADFVAGAQRAQRAGFAGVELHGAHGYLLAQFFDCHLNRREDQWGGAFQNRIRIFKEILAGIRRACGKDFLVMVRISPENYGSDGDYPLRESLDFIDELLAWDVDVIHASLWDSFKIAKDQTFDSNQTLLEHLAKHIDGRKPLMVAGKIWSPEQGQKAIDSGADMIALGKVAIGNPDWPKLAKDQGYSPDAPPYTAPFLQNRQVGEDFIEYLKKWPDFMRK